jgi:hypothetical protein
LFNHSFEKLFIVWSNIKNYSIWGFHLFLELLNSQRFKYLCKCFFEIKWINFIGLNRIEIVWRWFRHIMKNFFNKFCLCFSFKSIISILLTTNWSTISFTYILSTTRASTMSWVNSNFIW